eukprot:SAG25_NODE_390_length_8662_cov_4.211141_8_plen_139_part_00
MLQACAEGRLEGWAGSSAPPSLSFWIPKGAGWPEQLLGGAGGSADDSPATGAATTIPPSRHWRRHTRPTVVVYRYRYGERARLSCICLGSVAPSVAVARASCCSVLGRRARNALGTATQSTSDIGTAWHGDDSPQTHA